MQADTVRTVGVVLVVIGALAALSGAFIPDVEVGGSASGGSGTAEGSVSVGFGGLLWVGLVVMAVGLVLAIAGLYAPDRPEEPAGGDQRQSP
ncbi:hypothetical protein BRD56_03340 [Thermoplasmatales archaeon SW_10_69_26]|nr:MAG: hypothetical protein BRD56_03340 [Thermoplasmatales archaeon SW_10_69_26]